MPIEANDKSSALIMITILGNDKPNTKGWFVTAAIKQTVDTVNEIVASTDPKNIFMALCTWLLMTALIAPSPSGERINKATKKSENSKGALRDSSRYSDGAAFILVIAITEIR